MFGGIKTAAQYFTNHNYVSGLVDLMIYSSFFNPFILSHGGLKITLELQLYINLNTYFY